MFARLAPEDSSTNESTALDIKEIVELIGDNIPVEYTKDIEVKEELDEFVEVAGERFTDLGSRSLVTEADLPLSRGEQSDVLTAVEVTCPSLQTFEASALYCGPLLVFASRGHSKERN